MLITIADEQTSPVPLALLKQLLRIEHNEDDLVLEVYRDAAVAYVETETSRILAAKTLEHRLDAWPWPAGDWPWNGLCWPWQIDIPAAPVRDVRSVSYLDENGTEQTVDDADWVWDRTTTGAMVRFADGWSPPLLATGRTGVLRVQFDAGYDAPEGGTGTGIDPEFALPRHAKPCVLLLAAHWYENGVPIAGAPSSDRLPSSVQALLDKMRIYR